MKKSLTIIFCLFFVIWIKPQMKVGELRGKIECKTVEFGIPSRSGKNWITCTKSNGKILLIPSRSIAYIEKS